MNNIGLLVLFLFAICITFATGSLFYRNKNRLTVDQTGNSVSSNVGNMVENNTELSPVNTVRKFDLNTIGWLADSLIIFDYHLCLLWANETAEKWFTLSNSKDKGIPLSKIIKDNELIQYITEKNTQKTFESIAPTNSGLVLHNQIYLYQQHQFLLHSRDVTRIKKLEVVRQDFVDNVSHELRTPVTIVHGYLQMMMQDTDIQPQWQTVVTQMYQQTSRMKTIIADMLTLSQIEETHSQEQHQFIKLSSLLELAVNNAKTLNGEKKHNIDIHFKDNFDLFCNHHEMRILLDNLLSNAIRYTQEKGNICIRWDVDLVNATLSVEDNGIGIDATEIPRITERFYRVDPARSRELGGTGLGLAIVNHIVNRHQAKLLINSKVKKGSTFTIAFPLDRVRKNKNRIDLLLN